MTAIPIALTIAGSDSGGGAGIQADLKSFQAFGVFGTSAITAITVQNTLGVSGVHAVPTDIVRAQIRAVAGDLPPMPSAPSWRSCFPWPRSSPPTWTRPRSWSARR